MMTFGLAAAYTRLGKFCQRDAAVAETAAAQQLLQELVELLPPLQQQLDARGLSNIIWGCAYAQHPSVISHLLPAFLQQVDASAANPFDISNIMWALANRGVALDSQQLQQVMESFIRQVDAAESQGIANVLWAVATMGQQLPAEQCTALVAGLVQKLDRVVPQAIANSLWACAKFGCVPIQLLTALEEQEQEQQTQALVAAAIPQHLANMAWACGQLGYKGKLLPSVLLLQASVLMQQGSRSFNCQHLCNLKWSLAVPDMQQHIPSVLQLARATTDMWDNVGSQHLHQLYQVHLWLQDCQLPTGGAGLGGVLTQQQLQQCRSSWEEELTRNTAVSKASGLQQSVFTTLQQLPATTWQQPPVMEQRTADGAFSIDIAAFTAAGVALAIEVDGPSHFVLPGNVLDGPTQSRNRALAARGYSVISIPYQQWDRLNSQQRMLYVKEMLQQCHSVANSATPRRRRRSTGHGRG